MSIHDGIYHRLFSHPAMVTQLLREFVAEPWVSDLRLEEMERLNTKLHAGDGQQRDSDVIWRIPMTGGGDAYLLLLLEFQSTPDRWMALRAMVYAGLLWQQLLREQRIPPDGLLPPVFPLVLYNGNRPWRWPGELKGLIGLPGDSPLWRWQPSMEYHLLDEGAFAETDLARRDTLAALLFRLEKSRQPEQIASLVDAVIDWFRDHPGLDALRPVFAALAGRVLGLGDGPGTRISEDLLEIRTMLVDLRAEWKQQWRLEALQEGRQEGRQEGHQEGHQQGRQQGRQQGHQEGQASMLRRQLERRFGALSPALNERLAAAEPELLEEWGLRILDAKSIDDVLG